MTLHGARSEGRRATDRIEVFAYPERTPEGDIKALFFARGIRHLPGAADAVSNVRPGDPLTLVDQPDNEVNPQAMLMSNRTDENVGWVPNYLVDMIHELRESFEVDVEITAEHVNPETTPPHMRLLCRLRAPWPDGYEPLSAPEFQPIVSRGALARGAGAVREDSSTRGRHTTLVRSTRPSESVQTTWLTHGQVSETFAIA